MNTATFSLATMAPAIPEIVLLLLACVLLIVDLFMTEEERHVTYWLTQVSLVGCALLTLATLGRPTSVTFQGMFVADMLSQVLKAITLLTVAATLMLGRTYLEVRGLLKGEILIKAILFVLRPAVGVRNKRCIV